MAQSLMCRGAGEEKNSHPEKSQIPQEFGPWMKTSQLSVYDPNYE